MQRQKVNVQKLLVLAIALIWWHYNYICGNKIIRKGNSFSWLETNKDHSLIYFYLHMSK